MSGFIADCRARVAFDVLGHTWNGVVLWALRQGPCRPVELRARIGGISAKVLNETLRRLERDGLVTRRRFREAPPRVEYGLTPLGRTLLPALEAFGAWASVHGDAVAAAREGEEGDGADVTPRRRTPTPGS
ncbi:winged helix-turn-helix transcriptional regulator [Streptomyces radicis]|uniref:Transcriptional regulator n=1 Tax=Streptomyces radicis TaxID=1750517 RepID=A0A3A9WKP9_9ACTN|nr:helix-turn-helix domain-containing protein [Streptomyces radicis]RKN10034.1 transcriptional regulator [Streptomyces radicis]RKN24375.1 transcriptional regulator [Streptomyces radicis]